MKIVKLTTTNFLGVNDGAYPVGEVNRLTGRNGTGKTAVGRALLFALTGMTPALAPAAGAYSANSDATMTVELEFDDGRTLLRKRTKTATPCAYDRAPATEANLETQFGIGLMPLAVALWPETFFLLSQQKRRELFLAITPPVNTETVFASLTGGLTLPATDWAQSPRKLHETYAQRRLSLERDVAKLEGQIVEASTKTVDPGNQEPIDEQAAAAALYEASEEEAKLQAAKDQAGAATKAISEWEVRESGIAFAKAENARRAKIKTLDLEPLRDAERKLGKALTEVLAAIDSESNQAKRISERIAASAKIPETCPTCGQKWPHERPATTQDQANFDELKSRLADLEARQLSIRGEYTAAQRALADAERANNALGKSEPLPVPPPLPKPPEFGTAPLPEELTAARAKTMACARQLTRVQELASGLARLKAEQEAAQRRVETLRAAQIQLKQQLADARVIESALHPKTGVWAVALKQQVSNISLPGFRFEFSEQLANGEERDTFRCVRDSDANDVETLSSGERIKFCMALSALICDLTGSKIRTVFLERADLLDSVPALKGFQVFAERVTKTDFNWEVLR